MRWNLRAASIAVLAALVPGQAPAQPPVDARWIWFDEGDPAADAPAGKVWFRRELRASEPCTGAVRIACDDRFALWVNGRLIGKGEGLKPHRFNLNGIVGRGPNVIAVEASNRQGKAGLLVDGEIRHQGGQSLPFDSDGRWLATRDPPSGDEWRQPGFAAIEWKPARDLGPHTDSPWKAIDFGASYLDRYQLAPGFEIERIAEPNLVGSLVAITWGNRGRLIASREGGPILSVIDENGDGTLDKVRQFSGDVTNCQGLCLVSDELFAVGNGPQGTGMYRLADRNHDDAADDFQLVVACKGGMGEHGPHDVVLGPDGWLYHNLGNHAWITNTPQPTSPIRDYYEGDLLRPRYEDPHGHAAGIRAPGGTIWRFTPDGKRWWLHTNGFRNHYDIAFNMAGELFTFDSDMEWEVGMPFYHPVRVNHCPPGAECGWRSNAGKWPSYYFDSLPAAVEIGRGSPTGVVFYEHQQFPEPYRGAFIICDWSMGRIIAVQLKSEGASFRGTWETLASGNPLNVSDIEVDRDGSLVFSTGGRGTEGGIYRLSYTQNRANSKPPAARTLDDALAMPQPAAAWAREAFAEVKSKLGDQWQPGLIRAARTGAAEIQIRALTLLAQLGPPPPAGLLAELARDDDPAVRAFATWLLGEHSEPAVAETLVRLLEDDDPLVQRRACEAFVRSGLEAPAGPLVKLLATNDRFVRFAARLALERVPVERWRDKVLAANDPHVATHGLLALYRLGPEALAPEDALGKALEVVQKCPRGLGDAERLDALRMIELALLAGAKGPARGQLGEQLLETFPWRDSALGDPSLTAPLNMEMSRILAFLQVPGAAARIIEAMEQTESQALEIHYALVSSYLKEGWDYDLNRRLLDWYDKTQLWEGGHSFARWLEKIMTVHLAHFPPDDRRQLIETWTQRPFAARLLLRQSDPGAIRDYEETIGRLIAGLDESPGTAGGEEMVAAAIEALAKSPTPATQATLRELFDNVPDRRDQVARALAQQTTPENFPYLVRSLAFADSATLQMCIAALRGIDLKPEKPDEFRSAILAGLTLGDQGGLGAVELLEEWTGSRHGAGLDAGAALAHYQAWFREKYPDAPPPELPQADAQKTRYTYQELYELVEQSPQGRQGDPQRGELVFAKANCIKCHRFLNKGEGIGPDLTTVRRRFQRKEIIESLVYPSQVVSDQYRSVTVVTVDGQVFTGMPTAAPEDSDKVVLLLPDATRLEIPQAKIDEMEPVQTSVMPEGVLKDLSPQEIADMFAFLETSRHNAEAPANSPPATSDGQ